MKVSVVRGGGIAGLSTRTELDARDLAPEDARRLRVLVSGAALSEEPRDAGGQPWPDQMSYELVVVDDVEVRARFTDQNLPDGTRLLIEWIDSRPERTHRPEP